MPRVTTRPSREDLRAASLALRRAVFEVTGARICVRPATARGARATDALLLAKADAETLARTLTRGGALPRAFLIPRLGLFMVRDTPAQGELAGRIAIVTGAGSGLGRSIARGLARAEARVGLADVDLASARETAKLMAQDSGAEAAPIRCDVTSERAVARAVAAVLDRWGGLDILVNGAGIAPPYSLVDLPAEKWRQALEVNLTGYFLMAQAAARVMIRQGMGGSIIALSSKSGLEASRDNTAYNATKAGELHMARGWALELGEHGIRVNAVAPGNVFAGSRIWSREYIRACARKYGIKPQEVIPYYIAKTALKQELTGADVAEAVVFLCSERAAKITGQTLVVDGGQVMVR